jgi:hypothetical protein
MSLAIKFQHLRSVVSFLQLVAQPHFSHHWNDEDRFYVHIETETVGRRTTKKCRVVLWLPTVEFSDRDMNHVLTLIGEPAKHRFGEEGGKPAITYLKNLPEELLKVRGFSLDDFLKLWKLAEAKRPSRQKQDMLVALYGDNRDDLNEVFASLPKSPIAPTSIDSLGGDLDGCSGRPSFLIRLSQADPTFHWRAWMEMKNRRLSGDGPRRLQLFYKLPGDVNAEYFVEYGRVHPLPELTELYRNLENAHYILIGTARDGDHAKRVRTSHWTPVVPSAEDVHEEWRYRGELACELELQEEPHCEVANMAPLQETLHLRPTLESISSDRFESIERRIQGAKTALFDLEQQRTELSERQRVRFRVLMMFEQAQGKDQPLSPRFQRFLLQSRRQLRDFNYTFLEGGPLASRHVVLTRQAMLLQDLNLGLADTGGVYCQPHFWGDEGLSLFVRINYRLLPRLDDSALINAMKNHIVKLIAEQSLPTGEGEQIFLMDPAEQEASAGRPSSGPGGRHGDVYDAFRLTVLWMPYQSKMDQQLDFSCLARQLDFINAQHPVHEEQSRRKALAELTSDLDKMQVNLVAEVESLERKLKNEAAERLVQAHKAWNEIAPGIDMSARHIEFCCDRMAESEEIIRDFALTWRRFVDKMLALNQTLIEGKLEVLAKLVRKETEWTGILTNLNRGNEDVSARMPVREEFETKVKQAENNFAIAKERFETIRDEAQAACDKVVELRGRVDTFVAKARDASRRVERHAEDLESRQQDGKNVLAELGLAKARLAENLTEFDGFLERLRKAHSDVSTQVDELESRHKLLAERQAAWEKETRTVKHKGDEVDAAYKEAAAKIDRLKSKLRAYQTRAENLSNEANNGLARLRQQQQLVAQHCSTLDAQLLDLKQESDRLQQRKNQLEATRQEIAAAERGRNEQQEQVVGVVQQIVDLLAARASQLAPSSAAGSLVSTSALPLRLREAARQLADIMASLEPGRAGEYDKLRSRLMETADGLELLSRMEVAMHPLDQFNRAVALRATVFKKISPEQLKLIWGKGETP